MAGRSARSAILRETAGAFDAQEIALAQTFADQAVIAIENARMFNETQESLARQTATSDVLRVISESPTDVQPVFDIIAERAAALTGRGMARYRAEGELLQLVSLHGVNVPGTQALRAYGRSACRTVRRSPPVRCADEKWSTWSTCSSRPAMNRS